MRNRHYWPFVSAFVTTASSVQTNVVWGRTETWRTGYIFSWVVTFRLHSHLDSDQCSELLQCLPNAFQNIFFSFNAKISKSCQGVKLCTANEFLLHWPMACQRSFGLHRNKEVFFCLMLECLFVTLTLWNSAQNDSHWNETCLQHDPCLVVPLTSEKNGITPWLFFEEQFWAFCLMLRQTKEWQACLSEIYCDTSVKTNTCPHLKMGSCVTVIFVCLEVLN